MRLIVGLGNPGKEYEKTRHNIGFMIIDEISKKAQIPIMKKKFGGKYGEGTYQGKKIMLLKPEKFINLSGEVIKSYIDFYKIEIDDILVFHDDLDMECGKIKLKQKGSSGGHNGLKNIEDNLNTNAYCRIKVGISNNKNIETRDYVLENFKSDEIPIIKKSIDDVVQIFDDYLKINYNELMNKYNYR